jgi:hypothetical protein
MAEVLRTPFVTPERLAELRSMGVEIDTSADLRSMNLPDPTWGEEVLGELHEAEVVLLATMLRKTEEKDNLDRKMAGKMLTKIGQHLSESAEKPTHPFDTEGEALAFYRLTRECELLKANLFWALAERFNLHHYTLAIRSRGRVVKTTRLY